MGVLILIKFSLIQTPSIVAWGVVALWSETNERGSGELLSVQQLIGWPVMATYSLLWADARMAQSDFLGPGLQ